MKEKRLATGRHRAACSCGWRGPIVDTGVMDIWLDEELDDDLMVAWSDHVASFIPAPVLAALDSAQRRMTAAQHEVEKLVVEARTEGYSWNDIGAAIGVTKQAAQQRFG